MASCKHLFGSHSLNPRNPWCRAESSVTSGRLWPHTFHASQDMDRVHCCGDAKRQTASVLILVLTPDTDNNARTRMAAFREAGHGSSWKIFPHGRSNSLPPPRQAQDDLEALAPFQTAPPLHPPASSGTDADGHDTAATRLETGRSADSASATVTQSTVRQRNPSAREPSQVTATTDTTTSTAAEPVSATAKPKKQRTFFKHITPKEPFTVRNQIQRTLFGSWINLLLLAAPAGIAINYVPSVSRVAVFVVNFIAIIPLAATLSFATEEIALRTGETIGGLLNATFGYVRLRESVTVGLSLS